MASAHEVPNIYDLFISDGTTSHGYVLYSGWKGGETANAAEKAIHSYSPTFVPRTNIQGNYGDDSEDFFLTWSQNDWSQGEQRKYQSRGQEIARRYWKGSSVDVLTLGEVSIRPLVELLSFAAPPAAMTYMASESAIAVAGTTNLYTVTASGAINDEGVHGLGAATARWGMTSDGPDLYMTTEDAGTVGVRKWDGTTFTTFSATGSSTLAFLNNALYGLDKDGILRRYSTAGVASTLHTWQGADGTALSLGTKGRLKPFGGKLLILLAETQVPELWIYDGVGVSLLQQYSANFTPHGLEVLNGTPFVSGYLSRSSTEFKPVIYYLASGSPGKLWEADDYGASTGGPDVASFDEKLVFTDSTTSRLLIYNPEAGGISGLGGYTPVEDADQMVAAADSFLITAHGGVAAGFQVPDLVQSQGGRGVGTTGSASWDVPTTPGNLLLLAVHSLDKDGVTSIPLTPSGWTVIASVEQGTGVNAMQSRLYKIEGAEARGGVQQITFQDTVDWTVQLFEYSGVGVQDVAVVTSSGQSASPDSGTSLTTTQNEELWFSLLSNRTNAFADPTPTSPTNGFSLVRSQTDFTGGTSGDIRQTAFHKIVTATGTANVGATLSSSQHWTGIIATFKAKAVGEGYLFPGALTAVGGTVTHSLIDFDSHLDKLFRGIKVDYDEASDGDGGSVDIAYVVDDLEGVYTTLQEEAVSGTEYSLGSPGSEITGRSISVKIALNKGTSTDGPLLKRIYVRAAPQVQQRHRGLYHLACYMTSTGEEAPADNSGSLIPRTGKEMVHELRAFADGSTLLTFKDHLHEYTGVIERLEITQVKTGADPSYVVTLVGREV